MAYMVEKAKGQRSCIACGRITEKGNLQRIVRLSCGSVVFDATGRAPGRGAYICSKTCFDVACKTKKLERALKTKIDYNELERIAAEVSTASCEA